MVLCLLYKAVFWPHVKEEIKETRQRTTFVKLHLGSAWHSTSTATAEEIWWCILPRKCSLLWSADEDVIVLSPLTLVYSCATTRRFIIVEIDIERAARKIDIYSDYDAAINQALDSVVAIHRTWRFGRSCWSGRDPNQIPHFRGQTTGTPL